MQPCAIYVRQRTDLLINVALNFAPAQVWTVGELTVSITTRQLHALNHLRPFLRHSLPIVVGPRRLDVSTVVVPVTALVGLVDAAVLTLRMAETAHAEAACGAHAGVTVFADAEVVVSARQMLAVEVGLISAGLLAYPRGLVIAPRDANLFGDFAWWVAVGPGQLRAVFTEVDSAVQWARARAVAWWASGRIRASG